jgi:hypothetical protein
LVLGGQCWERPGRRGGLVRRQQLRQVRRRLGPLPL